jgi:hypothetical protein
MATFDFLDNADLRGIIDAQLDHCFSYTRHSIKCSEFEDRDLIYSGFSRLAQSYRSGRHFLQNEEELNDNKIALNTFFDALRSSRRKKVMEDVSKAHLKLMNRLIQKFDVDYLREFPYLDGYRVFAADGHYIEKPTHSQKSRKDRSYASGSIYSMDMRTGLMDFLCNVTNGSRKSHEVPPFEEYLKENSREKIPTVWILDRAYIDGLLWTTQSRNKQYLICRIKKNMALKKIGELEYESDLKINDGVNDYYLGAIDCHGAAVAVVDYEDPETAEQYTFYTTLPITKDLTPGLIAWLYRLRWDIEKSYDTYKNALFNQKAWATTKNAQCIQAQLTVMFHNLMRYLSEKLKSEGYSDRKVEQKRALNLKKREDIAQKKGRTLPRLLYLKNRMTQISLQFVRTFQNWFLTAKPYRIVKNILIQRLEAYI